MLKTLALLALLPLLALLQGCETMPVSLGGGLAVAASGISPGVVGTLATNPCEAATAAGYTAVHMANKQTIKRLAEGRITAAQAREVLSKVDQALLALDASCPGKAIDPLALAIAKRRIDELNQTKEAAYAR